MKTTEKPKISFIDGFKWAMPAAFSEALLKCKFEKGDILYDTREAYENSWVEAQGKIQEYIQIKYPPRSTTGTKASEDKLVFESNWVGEVVYDHYVASNKKVESVTTTQGRLFQLLLNGEEINNQTDPIKPLTLKDLFDEIQFFFYPDTTKKKTHKNKSEVEIELNTLDSKSDIKIQSYLTSKYRAHFAFIMPHSKIGATSSQKRVNIVKSFDKNFRYEEVEVSLEEAGIRNHDKYLPYLVMSCFLIKNGDQESVEAAIKSALYTPVKDKKTDRENYNIKKHGVLLEVSG